MRTLLACLLVLPVTALAEWKSMGARGTTVNDIEVLDAGQVLFATSGAGGTLSVLQIEPDGGVTVIVEMLGNFNGGFVFGGCMAGQTVGGLTRYSDAGCGTDFTHTSSPRGFRGFGTSGLAILDGVATTGLRIGSVSSSASTLYGPWGAPGPVVRTLRVGTVDLIGMNTANLAPNYTFRLSVDGGTPTAYAYPFGIYNDFSLFQRGAGASLAATNINSILVFNDAFVPDASVADTSSLGVALPRQIAVGSDVGMVITNTSQLASPVPNPSNPLGVWRLRRDIGVTWGTHIDCLETRWCAANDSSGNLWIYENANAPTVQAPTIVADAGTVVRVVLDAGDLDDDLLFHSWDAGGAALIANVAGLDGLGVDVTVPPGFCGNVPLTVTTTDGLNTVTTPVSVTVASRGAVQISAPAMTPIAGGGLVAFSAFVDGGCDSATFTWSTSSQNGAGPTFNYQPPATWCGGSDTITLTATWDGGAPSTTASMVITTPVPWGAPFTPTFPRPAMQMAGTSRVWSPLGPQHVCEGDGGFPGIALRWDPIIDAGAGVTATPVDGGLLVDALAACLPGQFSATASARVVNEAFGRESARGTLVVDLVPNIVPLDATAMFSLNASNDGGVVVGDTTVMVTCEPQRVLKTNISVLDGTTVVASGRFVAPGPFDLPVPGGCAGGTREVVARLLESDLDTGAERRQMVAFDITAAAVGMMTPSSLTARCGEGVRGQLRLLPAPGGCMAVQNGWRQIDGGALDTTQGVGVIDVSTAALDLSMVGQQLTFEWTVDGGPSNSATDQRSVDIVVDPFVSVSSRTFPIQRREESAFDVEVVLTNSTECAVDSLDVMIPVSGGTPIADTLVVNGARFDSTVEGTALKIAGVSLSASGRVVLRFSATPRLLGQAGATPEVRLRGLPVSIAQSPLAQPSGCGCRSTGSITLVLLAFFALTRRRRRMVMDDASHPAE